MSEYIAATCEWCGDEGRMLRVVDAFIALCLCCALEWILDMNDFVDEPTDFKY